MILRRKFIPRIFKAALLLGCFCCCGVHGTNVIQGESAFIPCYNPETASQFSNMLVILEFQPTPTAPQQLVSHYQPAQLKEPVVFASGSQFRGRLQFMNTGQLEIKFINLPDEGTYTCTAQVYSLAPSKIITSVIVYVAPQFEVRKVNDPLLISDGGTMVNAAECIASNGKPPAVVFWGTNRHLDFDQTATNSSTTPLLTTAVSTLHVEPTKFYNKQSFYCEMRHPSIPNSKRETIYLNVTYPPETPTITVTADGLSLTCISHANPPASISWLLPASAPSRTFMGPTVSMVSPNTAERSNDTYTCTANNGIGVAVQSTITAGEASAVIVVTKESNVGIMVGAIIGSLFVLAIIIALIYFFIIRPAREKDTGPYDQPIQPFKADSRQSSGRFESTSRSRPLIEHANESLNQNRPPSPNQPPPEDVPDSGSSDSDSSEGNHDVDFDVDPSTNLVDRPGEPAGITSRASVNFQPYWRHSISEARRKRPSTSPASRRSRIEPKQEESPSPAPRQQQPRYDYPPEGSSYDENDQESPTLQYNRHGYPDEEFSDPYHQPAFVGYPPEPHQPPRRTDSLPQYEPKYTEIDHGNYKKGTGQRRPQYEEPVEYAQIRHGYSHVV
ncbi:uncharacterized protein LOC100176696 isoform X1 [Ciona intestinalis]